ncbi:hypothetical protein OCU04_011354 [Sclerotinia nivalis]|uniref:Uncharacterized protein n=1 Tax=Sclerotinia nivalis TaxID=352851 RepID=A0A9X0ABB9_9HELO|nr:hypothetical protein OCU04_011354 [Sclerotinia nivalis]
MGNPLRDHPFPCSCRRPDCQRRRIVPSNPRPFPRHIRHTLSRLHPRSTSAIDNPLRAHPVPRGCQRPDCQCCRPVSSIPRPPLRQIPNTLPRQPLPYNPIGAWLNSQPSFSINPMLLDSPSTQQNLAVQSGNNNSNTEGHLEGMMGTHGNGSRPADLRGLARIDIIRRHLRRLRTLLVHRNLPIRLLPPQLHDRPLSNPLIPVGERTQVRPPSSRSTRWLLLEMEADRNPAHRGLIQTIRTRLEAEPRPHLDEHWLIANLQMIGVFISEDTSLFHVHRHIQHTYLMQLASHLGESEQVLMNRILELVRGLRSLLLHDGNRLRRSLGGGLMEELRQMMQDVEDIVPTDPHTRQQERRSPSVRQEQSEYCRPRDILNESNTAIRASNTPSLFEHSNMPVSPTRRRQVGQQIGDLNNIPANFDEPLDEGGLHESIVSPENSTNNHPRTRQQEELQRPSVEQEQPDSFNLHPPRFSLELMSNPYAADQGSVSPHVLPSGAQFEQVAEEIRTQQYTVNNGLRAIQTRMRERERMEAAQALANNNTGLETNASANNSTGLETNASANNNPGLETNASANNNPGLETNASANNNPGLETNASAYDYPPSLTFELVSSDEDLSDTSFGSIETIIGPRPARRHRR